MNAHIIQKQIDKLNYWDARVLSVLCDHFADEVCVVYENESGSVSYNFLDCYKVEFNHCLSYEKPLPSKQLSLSQIPYFLQDVVVGEVVHDNVKFHTCKINMFPLNVEIWCKNITINVS